ncbi:MAG: transaldolase [Acidimicrobiia bacterium]|nr:transaldolase [Acidimicrobiia bacterium]
MSTRLQDLYDHYRQSAWLDDLDRRWLASGSLARWVERGVRGVTSNPTIFARAMASSDVYADELAELVASGAGVEAAYWRLAEADVGGAADVLRPVYDASGGADGFVSIEVDPGLAHDTQQTVVAARAVLGRIDRPNVYVKVPATLEGVPAVRQLVSEGLNVNITLIFGLERYEAVVEAYLSGLEARNGDLSGQTSVASFFVSRVDTEVNARLADLGPEARRDLESRAGIAQARAAYQVFGPRFAGPRWEALAARGAKVQRPLWASTSTKDPSLPDTLYLDSLIGPDTVNTAPTATLEAFIDHGSLARTVDADPDEARATLARLADVGVDLDDVTAQLEKEGVAAFAKSYDEALATLEAGVDGLSR